MKQINDDRDLQIEQLVRELERTRAQSTKGLFDAKGYASIAAIGVFAGLLIIVFAIPDSLPRNMVIACNLSVLAVLYIVVYRI